MRSTPLHFTAPSVEREHYGGAARFQEFFLRGHVVMGEEGGATPGSGQSPPPRPRLFVSRAELDDERFRKPADRWVEHWTAREGARWDLRAVVLKGHGHFSAASEAFRQGLAWLFEE